FNKIFEYDPKLIGITAFTTKMTASGKIANELKRRNSKAKLIIGGHHSSALPERTLLEENFDFAVKGEGYYPLVGLLEILNKEKDAKDFPVPGVYYLKEGKIISNPPAKLIDLNELPLPAWDLLPMDKYRAHHWQVWNRGNKNSYGLVFSSLGCPFNCDFCSVNVVYGKRGVRNLKPEQFVEQIDELVQKYNTEHIEIIDDTFTLNPERVEKICDQIIERNYNLNMWCFARTDRVDPKMLKKMKRAGINWVFMGIESGTDETLKGVSKNQNILQIKNAVSKIKDAGIYLGGNFVFGLPGDNHKTMQQTLDLSLEITPEWANFFIPMAYPGTKLYEEARGKGILPKYWEQYGFFAPNAVALPTKELSSKEIITFRDHAFNVFFGSSSYQAKVRQTFGEEIEKDVQEMLKKELERIPNPDKEEKYSF
ncbi:MAG: radical SAM protein, partial [Candidatus Pacearchaeota archaeon]|nr:radical SAM protein [Candidatus Pacearchaeota archaeon]